MEKSEKQEILDAFKTHTVQIDARIDANKQELLGAFKALTVQVDARIEMNKGELLDAFASLTSHIDSRIDGLETRMGGMEERMGGMEERLGALTQEMRTGYEKLDKRLYEVEESVQALSRAVDIITEGDVLGKEHITLTRPEYDTMVTSLHIPNRFTEVH